MLILIIKRLRLKKDYKYLIVSETYSKIIYVFLKK